MKTTKWHGRLLSALLAACMILSLIPAAMPDARAEESTEEDTIAAQTSELVGQLTTDYNSFGIPRVDSVNFNNENIKALEGYYFMVVGSNEAQGYRVIDYSAAPQTHIMRLTANSYQLLKGDTNGNPDPYQHLFSIPANYETGLKINGTYPKNLDFAVELVANRVPVTYNTTSTDSGQTGWLNYTKWEFERHNSWSIEEPFGEYLFIPEIPKQTDTAYNIRSLHPSRISDPWLSCFPNSGQLQYSGSPFPFFPKLQGTSCKIYKTGPNADSIYNHWLGLDVRSNYYITAATISQIVREDQNYNLDDYNNLHNQFAFNWHFFRISGLTVELFRALDRAKSFAIGNNPGAKYPAELYLRFLQLTKNAMDEYTTYRNVMNNNKTDPTRIRLDILARELRDLTELLEIEANPNSYTDIPLEILDFRADGLLFEGKNTNTAYSLSTASPATVGGTNRPGDPKNGDSKGSYLKDLIESQLEGGRIVYRKEAVDYIAAALEAKHHTFGDASIDFGENYMDAYYNKTFTDMVDNGIVKDGVRVPMTKGDYYETLGKTTSNGDLAFSEVETYYDLAYYMLTYIWRQTPSDDIVETVSKDGTTYELPYNKKIDEINTIRLIKNSSGQYTFSSDLANGRDLESGIIYNYPTFQKSHWNQPKMNAAAGLGFENADMFGINTTGAKESTASDIYQNRNYHVVYHMESAFVYYESKNLKFDFSGDDDVYFFINGHLVCDIGGMHPACDRSISLNGAIAEDLGLSDGDICTFDMYLAERHTTEINLNFQTNIDMMPNNTVTEKVQYAYSEAGTIGTEIREGAIVSDNTEVGYGFKLLNRSKHGVDNLIFTDDNLGVSLSADKISLNNTANAEDLIFIYSTYDPDNVTLCTDPPTACDYETLLPQLAAAIDDFSTIEPMQEGVYRLTGLSEAQIMELMRLGLPASVQLAVYGFHRTVHVGSYSNEVVTTCTPLTSRNSDGSYNRGTAIGGRAARTLSVQNIHTVTAKPLQIVIDYGKSVEFSYEDILNCLSYDPLDASVTFEGIRTDGVHGSITLYTPGNLRLKTAESKDGIHNIDTLNTPNGVYTRWGDTFRFTPSGIMNDIDHAYAVFKVTDSVLSSTWYLMVGIDIVPATMMYYETEELIDSGDLTLEEKSEGTVNDKFTVVSDSEEDQLPSITAYDPTLDQKVLYFGFENNEADRTRYTSNPIYGNTNFDLSSSWVSGYGQVGSVANGIIGFTSHNTGGSWAQFYTTSGYPLKFIPSDNDWIEVRMRIILADPGADGAISFCPEIYTDVGNGGLRTRPWKTIRYADVGNDFFVLKFPAITDISWPSGFQYQELSIIRRISLTFESLATNTAFAVDFDYFYIGPEETCPSNLNADFLYFGFDNTAVNQYRYDNPIYGGRYNFDKAPTYYGDSWVYNNTRTPAFALSDGAMTVTSGTAGVENANSPYIQTGLPLTNTILNYPTDRAEIAQVKLKFSNLTTDVTADTDTDHPVARMMFMYYDESLGMNMYCQTDWDLTEEQLNGCEYMTLTAEIDKLLAEHNVKTITSVRLTILNAAAISATTGTFTVDYLYVGPKPEQGLDSYITAPDSVVPKLPARESYTPDYDDRVLFFDFDGTGATRYATTNGNQNYGNVNFDALSNWNIGNYSNTLSGQSISNGELSFSVAPDNSWCAFGTGATATTYPLRYTPSADDYFEIRMSVSGASGTATGVDVELWNAAGKRTKCAVSLGQAIGGTGYFVKSFHIDSAPKNTGQTTSQYPQLGSIVSFTVLPTGLKAKTKVTVKIDYIYIGPKEHRPSEQKRDYLYFGFENDESARYKYANEVYALNYDAGHWNYNIDRSSAPSFANGIMTATLKSAGHAWFETARGGYRGTPAMKYVPTNAEEVRVRVRFTNLKTVDNTSTGNLFAMLYRPSDHGPDTPTIISLPIPKEDITTNGKWFTYRIEVGSGWSNVAIADSFRLTFNHIYSPDNTGKVEIDYIYVGPSLEKEPEEFIKGNADPYGYDALYTEDTVHSDHKTIFTVGKGVQTKFNTENYTKMSFDFVGTGFDIISRTGVDQGSVRAMIYTDRERTQLYKASQAVLKGVSELGQIPVLSVQDLPYDHYYVDIGATAPYDYGEVGNDDEFGGALDRGGEFYFDALRIYDPIKTGQHNDASETAGKLYRKHGEYDPAIVEVRNLLIDADSLEAGGSMEGAAYLDAEISAFNRIDLVCKDSDRSYLIRRQETNLGDFAADALYYLFSSQSAPIDGAIVTAGSIRSDLSAGKLYNATAKAVHPTGNQACLQTVTGQQLLDALEWGARSIGAEESENLLQVSGITYEIHTQTAPNVKTEKGKWAGTAKDAAENATDIYENYRVKNVTLGGKALDLNATYHIAGYKNIVGEMRDGFAMFKGSAAAAESTADGAFVLLNYAKAFPLQDSMPTVTATDSPLGADYTNANGEGRIAFVGENTTPATLPTQEELALDKKAEIRNYMELGPNNEVYLTQNTAIAFKVEAVGELPATVDIGAKSVKGDEVSLNIAISATPPATLPTSAGRTLTTKTTQYYSLDIQPSDWENDVYITISNTGAGTLSITDIKYAYDTEEPHVRAVSKNRYLRFLVNDAMVNALAECTEHKYTYTDSGELHTAKCTTCGYEEMQEHNFESGCCICGAPKPPVLDENLTFAMDISAGAEMTVTYSILAEAVSSFTDFCLEVSKDSADGEPHVVTYGISDGHIPFEVITHPVSGKPLVYSATFNGINAKEMGDSFEATVYAVDEEGNVYCSKNMTDSIKDFLYRKVSDEAAIAEAKTMAVDMLKYGATAQVHFGYDTENLVTADLSEEQLALGTQEVPEAIDHASVTGEGANVNTNITVNSKVELNLSCIAVGQTDVKCIVTDREGNVLSELATVNIGGVMYSAKYDNVGAKQMREVICATFVDGNGNAISKTVNWSVESYVAQTRERTDATEGEIAMVNAMLVYGDSVAAYMAAQ